MTDDSTSYEQQDDVTVAKNMKTPRLSTLSYVRQFANSYYSLQGTVFEKMIAN